MACTALAPLLAPPQGVAEPTGATVVAGSATVSQAGPVLTVQQAGDRAIINWRSFSIGAGETARFIQPSAAAAILNRVTGADPSALMGQLSANGRVYLINPNGVVVGPNGRIETGGFVASTLDVPDADFLGGGPLRFAGASTAGVKVLGSLKAADGDVVLVAARVENAGRIEATAGQAILAAGGSLIYVPNGSGDIVIETPASGAGIDNSGAIAAAAVQLRASGGVYGLAVRIGGEVAATSLRQVGGRVVIDAGDGEAQIDGAVTARNGADGGTISVTGGAISVADMGRIDASGEGVGSGGEVLLLASGTTRFEGRIAARAGDEGGDGGEVEVSGGDLLFRGLVDAGAARGRAGHLLLDPATLSIDASEAANIVAALATTNVTAQADSLLTVDSAIVTTSVNTLRLDAPTIQVNANIDLGGQLEFMSTNAATGAITSVSGATIKASQIYLPGDYTTANFAGALITGSLTLDTGSRTSFTATNAANQISALSTVMASDFTGNVAISSSTAMTVDGDLTVGGALALTSAGNLTFQSSATYTTTGQATLRAGGAFINNAGSGLFPGSGRVVIYSSSTGFVAGGLGYPTFSNVNFPSDPQSGNVVYFSGGLPTLTITANNASRLYGAANPTFTASFSGGSASDLNAPLLFRVLGPAVNVGTYAIEPFGASSSTHLLAYVNGVLTVTPAPLTITANAASRSYGQANPAFTASYSGLVNGDTSSVVSGLTFATAATAASGLGAYAIVPSGASAGNYTLSYVNGALTVVAAVMTITANDASRHYGDPDPTFSASYGGGSAADLTTPVSFRVLGPAVNVGTYAIQPYGGASANYVLNYVNGVLTVTPAVLTVIVSNAVRRYGEANPAFGVSYVGLVNGDAASVVSGVSVSTTATRSSDIGDYTLVASGGSAANYTLRYFNGSLVVVPAPLTIATQNATRLYGDANPGFGVTYSGLVNGDTGAVVTGLSITTAATAASDVGTYAIEVAGGTARNYVITRVGASLTVTPAPLTVRASDTQIMRDSALPPFGAVFEGFRNNDGPDLVRVAYAVDPNAPYAVGTYAIVPTASLVRGANYSLRTVNGALSVIQPPPIVYSAIFTTSEIKTPEPTVETIVSITGTADDAKKAVDQFGQDIKTALDSQEQVVVCGGGCMIFTGAARTEFNRLLDTVAATVTTLDVPVSAADIKLALADQDTATATLAALMPYIYANLETILGMPEGQWTPAQAAFVDAIRGYIETQRKANAAYALSEYQKWAMEQYEIKKAAMADVSEGGIGNTAAGFYQAGVYANEPPVPPKEILEQLKLGFVIDNSQYAAVAGINFDIGRLADEAQGDEPGQKNGTIAHAISQASLVGAVLATEGVDSAANLAKLSPGARNLVAKIAPMALRRAARAKELAQLMIKTGEETFEIAAQAGDLAKMGQASDQILEGVEATAKLAKGFKAAKAIPVVGLIIGIAADWIGVAITTATYVQIGDYNKAFDDAYAAAQAPVSNDALRAMLQSEGGQSELNNYLVTMMATGGKPPVTDTTNLTRTQITSISMATS